MIKSLYVRVVIIFIGAVIVSLILAFFLATQLYSSNLKRMIEENMIESGKRMIQALQHSNNDTARNPLDGIFVLPGFVLRCLTRRRKRSTMITVEAVIKL